MARLHKLSMIVLLALLSVRLALSTDPPQTTPSPAPELGSESISLPPEAGGPASPSPLPELSSPPAPPPSDLPPGPSPTSSPAPSRSKKSPAPAPSEPSDVTAGDVNADPEEAEDSSDGIKGGQKAGIVVGVIAGACLVGFGGMVYRKRQQNIRRSQYGYAARREIL